MHTTSSPFIFHRRFSTTRMAAGAFAMALSVIAAPTFAQTPTAPEETIVLSPFVVEESPDTGYAAEETLAGTRLRTLMRDTPVALSVLTSTLLDDLGATDFRDVLDFVPSTDVFNTDAADPVGNGAAGKDPTTMVVRGFRTNTQTRNFFASSLAADRYNSQGGFTFTRGPNALLFGIGNPGGGIHIQTNRAKFNNDGGSVSAQYDTENSYRVSLDKNFRLIKDRLAARVDLLWEESQGFQTPSERNKRAAFLTATAHPFKNDKRTTIVANYERGRRDDVKARPFAPYDNFSTWVANGAPLYDNFVDARPGTVFSASTPFMRNENFFVNVLGQDYAAPYRTTINQVINGRAYRSFVRSVGPIVNGQAVDTNSMMTDFVSLNPLDLLLQKFGGDRARLDSWLTALGPARAIPEAFASGPIVIPMDTFVSGDRERIVQDWSNATLMLEQRIGANFDIELAGYVEDLNSSDLNVLRGSDYGIQYDPNLYLPNGAPNPYAGVPYVQNNVFALNNVNDAISYEQRATTRYQLDLNNRKIAGFGLGRYVFSTLINFYRSKVDFHQARPHVTSIGGVASPNVLVAANRLHDRYYFVPGQPLFVHDPLLPLGNGAAYAADFVDVVATRTRNAVDSYAASMQGYLLNDHLVVLGGIRRDVAKTWSTVQQTYTTGTASATNYPGEVDLAATYNTIAPQTETTVNNTSMGLVYHVIEPVSLFYNRATNANPRQVQRDVFYNVVPHQRGEGIDYGFKFKLFAGKLQGSYTRYETTQQNNTGTGFVGPANFDDNIDLILQLVDPAEYTRRSSFGVAWVAVYDTVTTGDELEFVFNPTPNFRLRVAASRQDTETARKYDDLLQYLSSNLPTWQNFANNTSNPQASRDVVNTSIQAINADLPIYRSVNGSPQVGLSEYSASASASYTFPRDSFLDGFAIGTNISYRGPVVLGYQVDADGTANLSNQRKSSGPRYVNLHVTYRRKINRHLDWSIQAQVSNVFNDTDPILRNAIWDYNTRAFVVTQNSLTAPPKLTLTSTLRF